MHTIPIAQLAPLPKNTSLNQDVAVSDVELQCATQCAWPFQPLQGVLPTTRGLLAWVSVRLFCSRQLSLGNAGEKVLQLLLARFGAMVVPLTLKGSQNNRRLRCPTVSQHNS